MGTTVDVHVFDPKEITPRVAGHAASVLEPVPQGFGHLEVVAHGNPDDLGIGTAVERLIDRPTAESGENVVGGNRCRPRRPELGGHQSAELGQSHAATLLIRAGRIVRRSAGPGPPAPVPRLLSYPPGRLGPMDPTGLSSPFGQLVIAAGLLASIVVGVMALRRRRK